MKAVNIALLQLIATPNNMDANLRKGDKYCRQAKKLGADIVLFPEMWSIGYTSFHPDVMTQDFNPSDNPYAEDIKTWQNLAVSSSSLFVKHFQSLAKELDIAIMITYLERQDNGAPRNSASLIDRTGNILFTYGKVHTCDFSSEAACAPGDNFYVAELDTEQGKIKIGAMICYDREFPESARILMLQGAEIILTPNACELEANRLCQFKTRAMENMVGVAMANYAGPPNNGHSCAYDGIAFTADGKSRDMTIVLADENEKIVMATFDMEKIRAYRQAEGWGNSYRKPARYAKLIDTAVAKPFIRHNARR
jgi:N-carbamoylputrescine amidase